MSDQAGRKLYANAIIAMTLVLLPGVLAICGGLTGQSGDVEATVAAGVAATQQAEADLQATIETAVEATQAAGRQESAQATETTVPPTAVPLPTSSSGPTPLPDPQQVRSVILNEVNGAISQDLDFLKTLYAPDAVVIDRNGTPGDPSDDTTWQGWANIERRYRAFFASGFSSLNLVDLSIQVNGDEAVGTHQGVALDGTLYQDQGTYSLEKIDGRWLITRLEFGNETAYSQVVAAPTVEEQPSGRDDGLYELELGDQHRYEEPWGWDRGDPCAAWASGNFDDTKPDYRGFNVELLLTNNSDEKVPDDWPITFTTAAGKLVKACYYGYDGSGPVPGATSSVTFFTVVEKGDYVERITFSLNGQTINLCLDGRGGWSRC